MVDLTANGSAVVTGASGYIGSWLVKRLLQAGYSVRATVRDPNDQSKAKPLLSLPENEDGRLSLWKADMCLEGSFDDAVAGSIAVFHTATIMEFNSQDPENDVIMPTVNGILNVMKSCKKSNTVKRVIFTSSAGALNVQEHPLDVYDENCWSDLDFIYSAQMTLWKYFASKILAEKAAFEFAKENDMDLISIIPPLVVGPFLINTMPPSMHTALSLITGETCHYSILKQIQLVHLDDLCKAHIFLMEHPEANGRYICSSHELTIYDLAEFLRARFPDYEIPTKFEGIDENIEKIRFSSEKLMSLGFNFEYSIEDMYYGAIGSCQEKNLIPSNKPIDV